MQWTAAQPGANPTVDPFALLDLQRERKKAGARKDVGHTFVAEAHAGSGGKQNSTSGARSHVKGRGDRNQEE